MGDNIYYVVVDKDDEVGFFIFFLWFINYEVIFIFIVG